MRFVFYSEKTVSQCLTAIRERIPAKGSSARAGFDGWTDKSGDFALGKTTPVIGKFSRHTSLRAKVEREDGVTVIKGEVPNGVSPVGQVVVYVALALVTVVLIASGNVLFGLLLIPFAAYLYIPMRGDYLNSESLIDEVRKTLKARPTPPKKSTGESKPVAKTNTNPVARPGVPKPTTPDRRPTSTPQNRTPYP